MKNFELKTPPAKFKDNRNGNGKYRGIYALFPEITLENGLFIEFDSKKERHSFINTAGSYLRKSQNEKYIFKIGLKENELWVVLR